MESGGGGASQVFPYKNEGGGGKQFLGLSMGHLSFSHTKGGVQTFSTHLKGVRGAQNILDPQFSHFVAPPPPSLPVMNDQSPLTVASK